MIGLNLIMSSLLSTTMAMLVVTVAPMVKMTLTTVPSSYSPSMMILSTTTSAILMCTIIPSFVVSEVADAAGVQEQGDDDDDYDDVDGHGYDDDDYDDDDYDDDDYDDDDDDYYDDNNEEDGIVVVANLHIPPIRPGELQILEFIIDDNNNTEDDDETVTNDSKKDDNTSSDSAKSCDSSDISSDDSNSRFCSESGSTSTTPNITTAIVHEFIARVGIPKTFVPSIRKYAEDIGLWSFMMTTMLLENQLPTDGDVRFTEFRVPLPASSSSTDGNDDADMDVLTVLTWDTFRPDAEWNSDMHWFSAADEMAHEHSLRALANAGMDTIFAAIGDHYGFDNMSVDGVGFVAVTHCEDGKIHHDFEDIQGKAFNLLIGIQSPPGSGPQFIVQDDTGKIGHLYYTPEYGVIVGDTAMHGTNTCDYRKSGGVRISLSVYISEVTNDNLKDLAEDNSGSFPPGMKSEWMWAQRARHWSSSKAAAKTTTNKNASKMLNGDVGRHPLGIVSDSYGHEQCEELKNLGQCLTSSDMRKSCVKTCNIFIDDEIYRVGEDRKSRFGF